MFFVFGTNRVTTPCFHGLLFFLFCALAIFPLLPLKNNGCSEQFVYEGSEIAHYFMEKGQTPKKSKLNHYAALSRNSMAKKRSGANFRTEFVNSHESCLSYGIYTISESLAFCDDVPNCCEDIKSLLSRSPPLYFF